MVNDHILDLFSALDHADARLQDDAGNFVGFDHGELLMQAAHFLASLRALGVKDLPAPDEVLMAFLGVFEP